MGLRAYARGMAWATGGSPADQGVRPTFAIYLVPSHTMRYLLGIGTPFLFLLHAQPPASPVLAAMNAELARTQAKLKSQPVPPYYISYEITETHSIRVSGEFGNLQDSDDYRYRQLDVDLRVGDYTLDNTREVRGDMMNYPQYSTTVVPSSEEHTSELQSPCNLVCRLLL